MFRNRAVKVKILQSGTTSL